MTVARSNAAIQRLDHSLADADLAFSGAVPSVPDMRVKAGQIASGRVQINAEFGACLNYTELRAGVRGVNAGAIARAGAAEIAHRRLRRRLFWRLIWVRYRAVFWVLLGLGIVSALGWTLWLWRVEILAFLLPPPVPDATAVPAGVVTAPPQLSPGQTLQQGPARYSVGPQ